MSWNFAIINNRMAEFYYDIKRGTVVPQGHCYVKRGDFKTKEEHKHINVDTMRYILSYRNKKYRDHITGKVFYTQERPHKDGTV